MNIASIARISQMTKTISSAAYDAAAIASSHPKTNGLVAGGGSFLLTGGDAPTALFAGAMIAGTSAILKRVRESVSPGEYGRTPMPALPPLPEGAGKVKQAIHAVRKWARPSDPSLSTLNESHELLQGFLGRGLPEYDAIANAYTYAGILGPVAAIAGGIHGGLDPQHILQSGMVGAGVGFTAGGFNAGLGWLDAKMRTFSASKADPLVDTLLGKINGPNLKRLFKQTTGRDLPAGIAEGIRDGQGAIIGTMSSELSVILGLGSTKGEHTRMGKAKGVLSRALYPVARFFKGDQADFVDDSILGTINAGINVAGAVKIPGTNVKVGGLTFLSGGEKYEPTMTSKMKLATAGVGLGSLATIGADIAMNGSPGALSAWAGGMYGMAATSRDWGGQYAAGVIADAGSLLIKKSDIKAMIDEAKDIPRQIAEVYKNQGGKESMIRTAKDATKAVISAPRKTGRMVKKVLNTSNEDAINYIADNADRLLAPAEKIYAPIMAGTDYIIGGNQKVLYEEIKRLMRRDPELGIRIGRGSTDFLSEEQRLDLATREIDILRRRRSPPIG